MKCLWVCALLVVCGSVVSGFWPPSARPLEDGCAGTRFLDPLPQPSPTDVLFPLPTSFSYGNSELAIDPSSFSFSSVGAQVFFAFVDNHVEINNEHQTCKR